MVNNLRELVRNIVREELAKATVSKPIASEYLVDGAVFVGKRDGEAPELFKLTLRSVTFNGTLYNLERLTDGVIRSFYMSDYVNNDEIFTNVVNESSDKFHLYDFEKVQGFGGAL